MSSPDPGLSAVVPFRFACTRCGHCCSGGSGHVWITGSEIEAMARALGMRAEAFVARHVREVVDPTSGERRWSLREDANGGGRCALLLGTNTCSVYAARPEHCRRFPYWERVLTDPAAFEAARATCPGIAVRVSPELSGRAEAALLSLYMALARRTPAPRNGCCRDSAADELFATGLEADFAVAHRHVVDPLAPGCPLGRGRPLACRIEEARIPPEEREAWFTRLRELERGLGYPASYARLEDLLRSRGEPDDKGASCAPATPS